MSHRLSIAALAGLVAGCAAGPGDLASDRAAITGGTLDQGDPAVAALLGGGQLHCTATLIAPDVLLTAAHCLAGVDPAELAVVFGSGTGGPHLAVIDALPHPDFGPLTLSNDIGLVRLAAPVDVPPAPLSPQPFAPWLRGRPARVVGFGLTTAAPPRPGQVVAAPAKRSGDTVIQDYDDTAFDLLPAPSHTCFGDSGGPVLVELDGVELLAGVTSAGDAGCSDWARATRVDAYLDFVTTYTDDACLAGDPDCGEAIVASSCSAGGGGAPAALLLALLGLRRLRASCRPSSGRSRGRSSCRGGRRRPCGAASPAG